MEIRGRVRLELRERDLEILSALEKWGVLGLAQMDGLVFRKAASAEERAGLFFNDAERRMYTLACYKRLRDLELGGFVRSHSYINHRRVFGLTDRGHGLLLERGHAKLLGFRRRMSEALLTHELTVNAVGLIIEQLLGIRVRPELERRIRPADPLATGRPVRASVSDLWIPDKASPKAIEVELTQKSELRYKELWQNYRSAFPYGAEVLYLVGWPDGVGCIRRLASKLEKAGGSMIYVARLRTFRESLGTCAFVNSTYYYPKSLILKRSPPEPAALAEASIGPDAQAIPSMSSGKIQGCQDSRIGG